MLIEIKNVGFKDIINYPDIAIEPEKVTFLCGESGSGKSTLLKLINGILTPSRGEILIEGNDSSCLDTVELRREYLLVSQSVYLFEKTIRENFEEFYRYRDLPTPEDEEMRSFLQLCCAGFPLESFCPSMSGGERQRVYHSICLSFRPKVLMLDEPTSALDSGTANLFMKNITEYCKENHITMIVVSHDLSLTEQYADRIIHLKGGS